MQSGQPSPPTLSDSWVYVEQEPTYTLFDSWAYGKPYRLQDCDYLCHMVHIYTKRHLTNEADALNAFRGVLHNMRRLRHQHLRSLVYHSSHPTDKQRGRPLRSCSHTRLCGCGLRTTTGPSTRNSSEEVCFYPGPGSVGKDRYITKDPHFWERYVVAIYSNYSYGRVPGKSSNYPRFGRLLLRNPFSGRSTPSM
jgi:hypothetical protein